MIRFFRNISHGLLAHGLTGPSRRSLLGAVAPRMACSRNGYGNHQTTLTSSTLRSTKERHVHLHSPRATTCTPARNAAHRLL